MSFYRTVGAKELEEHFLGRFLSLHLDNVPNIRLSVARGLTKLIQDSGMRFVFIRSKLTWS